MEQRIDKCSICDKELTQYSGIGRPVKYCSECITEHKRRYLIAYREAQKQKREDNNNVEEV